MDSRLLKMTDRLLRVWRCRNPRLVTDIFRLHVLCGTGKFLRLVWRFAIDGGRVRRRLCKKKEKWRKVEVER